eukprot:3722361-Amphidinium_carterae.1
MAPKAANAKKTAQKTGPQRKASSKDILAKMMNEQPKEKKEPKTADEEEPWESGPTADWVRSMHVVMLSHAC